MLQRQHATQIDSCITLVRHMTSNRAWSNIQGPQQARSMSESPVIVPVSRDLMHVVKKKGNVCISAWFGKHNTFYYVFDATEHLFGEKNLKEPFF